MNKEDRIEYLEEERIKIWSKIVEIEDLLNKKTPDYELEARRSAENALGFAAESEAANNTITRYLEDVNLKLEELNNIFNTFEETASQIKKYFNNSKENSELIKSTYDYIESKSILIQSQIAEIEKIIENKPVLDDKLLKLDAIFLKADDNDSKLNILIKSVNDKKKEIDEMYLKIFGYTITNEEGTEEKIEGLKDELESSYEQIKKNLKVLNIELNLLEDSSLTSYNDFAEEKQNIFNENINNWENRYSQILKKIEELLPNALTTGLSYAYSDKKATEILESRKLLKSFYIAIVGLIVVSLIPLAISYKSIIDKTPFDEVIYRIPRLALAILPLYIPVLWVAHSSNRKLNLTKRLIEEYAHKEVLSKTFEGLSKQINDIKETEISSDLRIKLLYNILEVNSENPGKLISDYNKSDHPLMDALDKSIKLSNAITKLSKIPGITKLANTLEKRQQEILMKETQKVNEGISSLNN